MEGFIFHRAEVPEGYQFSFEESLFNRAAHRKLQAENNWQSYFILNQKKKSVDGAVHFHLQDGIARSPLKATFGGFDLNAQLHHKAILAFVSFVEEQLKKLDTAKIVIKLPMRIDEGPKFNLIESILMERAFRVDKVEIGSIIEVKSIFTNDIHRSEKKRIRKATENHFEFHRLPISELKGVYAFILKCRTSKDYELSMSVDEMEKLAALFPNEIILFAVKSKGQFIAASICIRLQEDRLYDFYHDHDSGYNEYSPVVFLVKGINDYCYQNKIPLLDLGTSMIDGKINIGLHDFKQKLGGRQAVKYSFEKKL